MRAPIFIDDDGDLMVFASAELASRYIEPFDLGDSRLVAFDAAGTRLRLSARRARGHQHLVTEIGESGGAPTPGELAKLLTSRLARVGIVCPGDALDDLIAAARVKFALR